MLRKAKTVAPERALERLELMCSRAEHSEGEVREKLRRWGIIGIEADKIVDRLIDTRYVDDTRFARAYAHDKTMFSGWGRRKIRMALIAKRISSTIISDVLENIDDDTYIVRAQRIVASKTAAHPDLLDTYEGRTRLYKHLLSRGYEHQIINQALKRH